MNHCLECGDCVRACEWMIERRGSGPVPLLLGFFSGPQRIESAADIEEIAAEGGPDDLAGARPEERVAAGNRY